jgi:predicted metal-binding protein
MKVKDLLKDVGNVELTPEQEKQIKDYLGIKEAPKRFIPEYGDVYFAIENNGTIIAVHYVEGWLNDKARVALGNCFKTKEEAEFALEKYKIYQELKNFADENNDHPIEWHQPNISNYYIYLSHDDNALYVSDCWTCQDIGQIYFSSEELAKKAVEKVGEDRIKKYLFGVE